MKEKVINFKAIERKWQKKWEEAKAFETKEGGDKKKYYVLEMFPYPSASFLHMGHLRNYTIGDLIARYKRMKGFNVLYPMGFDAFGLPAENAAIKEGIHPKKYAEHAIKEIRRMMKEMGLSYDWSRELATCYPEYYRWNQWLFLRMLEKGIAYRKEAPVNWCPSCKTVLANDEVHDGKCWRCESVVTIKNLTQWFLKVTAYADELLKGLDDLEWSNRMKDLQRNWIGRSEGTKVVFPVKGQSTSLEVFTTRVDTLYGVSFLACAAQSALAQELVKGTRYEKKYKEFVSTLSASRKIEGEKEKEGVFTGRYAIHPTTGEEIPIYASNFVVAEYGTGVVMGVPAHDVRDFAFAKKYKLLIKKVIESDSREAYEGEGKLINSDIFNGLDSETAKTRISEVLVKKGVGAKTVEYKLRDWLISRQRYWGTPIPIIYCDSCGVVPVPEKDLPVTLPEKVSFSGSGNPLETSKDFIRAACPVCGAQGRRETDTMSTFVDSSWYYLRYCSPNAHDIFDRKDVAHWMPVDQYIGGIEHATGHLLYSRFFTKFLRDIGWVVFDEPFMRLFNQGLVLKGGEKMSKSKGNTVTVDEAAKQYGTDVSRLFLMFVAGPDKDLEWNEQGVEGALRVVMKLMGLIDKVGGKADATMEHKLNKTLKAVEHGYESFEFNKSMVAFMEFVNYLAEKEAVPRHVFETTLLMIAPVMPHLAEELAHSLGRATLVVQESWPKVNEGAINDKLDEAEKQYEKVVSDLLNVLNLVKEKTGKEGTNVYLYVLPQERATYDAALLSKRIMKKVEVFAVNDPKKYDPQNKSGKVKPGRPGIYVE